MLFVLRHSHRSRPFLLDMFVPAFVFPTAADGAEAEFPFFNLLHRRERKNLCSHNWSMDSSFCIFFTWAKIEFLQFGYRHVKKMASVQRDAIPLALGFQ